MPRPGPRPYECVRRAWHSDRHQPIRGSLIQHIFRVVNEAHSLGTKKNKEWQEKLPIVVLKAEEIMYSKANSEVEYSNLETVWDRVNDAINTIIRREETTESGDLLPPCVEAALNLGCFPVRASRSQRHSNPRTYLTPRTQDPSPVSVPRVTDRGNDERTPQFLQFHSGNQLAFPRTQATNCPNFHPEPNSRVCSRSSSHAAPSIYPVYYGAHYRAEGHQTEPRAPEPAYLKTIYVGTPVNSLSAVPEPTMQEYFMSTETVYARENPQEAECDFSLNPQEECWAGPRASEPTYPKTIYDGTPVTTLSAVPEPTMQDYFIPSESVDVRENPPEAECDLSLRLGTFLHPIKRRENISAGISPELGKVSDTWQSTHTEFCFFPAKPAGDPNESSSRMWKGKEPFRS